MKERQARFWFAFNLFLVLFNLMWVYMFYPDSPASFYNGVAKK